MEAILSFIPVPVAVILMAAGFVSLAVGGIRLGYKATVKNLALDLVNRAEKSIMGSGQGRRRKSRSSPPSAPNARPSSSGQSRTRCWILSSNTPLML